MHSKIIEHAGTWPGRVVLTALFLVVAWTFPPLSAGPQFLLIAFLSLAPVRKDLKLLIAVIFCFVVVGFAGLIPFMTNQEQIRLAVGRLDELDFPRDIAFRAIAFVFVAALSIGLNEFIWGKRAPLLKLIFAWAALTLVGIVLPPHNPIYIYLWGAISAFSMVVFPAAYMHLAGKNDRPSWPARIFFPLQELMLTFRFPVIRGTKVLERVDPREDAMTRVKALKLIVWSRVLYAFYNWLNFIVFGLRSPDVPNFMKDWTFDLPSYSRIGFSAYNALHLPWSTSWTIMAVNAFNFPLLMAVFSGISVALIRLSGVYVPRAVYRPYMARTFNDYYRRILFYYSEVLVNLFYYPAYGVIGRRVPALFFAIFVGGFIYHVIRESIFFMLYGATAVFYFLSMLPFFAIIALACSVSASGLVHRRLSQFLPWPLSLISVFVFHAVLITMMSHSPADTFHDRFEFWRSLLP